MTDGVDTSYLRKRVIKHWDLINRPAGRRFSDANMADEAALLALDALKSDDWRRVKPYQGRSRFTTFLAVIVNRLLEDFSRKRFGRPRPPKWVKDGGPLLIHVYRLLCEERYSFDEAVEMAISTSPGGRDEDMATACAETILAKIPNCGRRRTEAAPVDPHSLKTERRSDTVMSNPEKIAAMNQAIMLLAAVGNLLKQSP